MNGVCSFATPIAGGLDKAPNGGPMWDIVGICDHAAQGFMGTLMDPGYWQRAGVSVNFAISRKGEIGQILNLFTNSYGQGHDQNQQSITPSSPGISWAPWATMQKRNPNGYLVSVEHEDYTNINGVSRPVPGSEWTMEQYAADLRLKRWMVDEVRRVKGKDLLRFGIDSLASHHMFDPVNRAECAGRYWRNNYRDQLYSQLMGEKPVPTEDYGPMKLNADGSDRIESEGGYIVIYHQNVAVWRIGGDTAGQTAKLMGDGKYYNLAHQVSTDGHNAPVVFSDTLKD